MSNKPQGGGPSNPNTFVAPKPGAFQEVRSNQDASQAYANNHNYFISFQHIATGQMAEFKAFLTEFNDQFVCNWNDVDVYGRMDPISTFQGTKREISFAFDVVANSLDEAKLNFINSQRLIQNLYPVYERIGRGGFSATSIKAPPLLRIRFANLLAGRDGEGIEGGLVGKLSGLSYQPDLEAGAFTAFNQVIPKLNRFSCVFTVFHTEGVGFDDDGDFRGGDTFPYPTSDVFRADPEGPIGKQASAEARAIASSLTEDQLDILGITEAGININTGLPDPILRDPVFLDEIRDSAREADEE